jgi:hypothetical protein
VRGEELQVFVRLEEALASQHDLFEQGDAVQNGPVPGQYRAQTGGLLGGLQERGDLLAQGEDGLAENGWIGIEGGERGCDGMHQRREGSRVLTGVQAVFEGVTVGGLGATAARQGGRGSGIQHGMSPYRRKEKRFTTKYS